MPSELSISFECSLSMKELLRITQSCRKLQKKSFRGTKNNIRNKETIINILDDITEYSMPMKKEKDATIQDQDVITIVLKES